MMSFKKIVTYKDIKLCFLVLWQFFPNQYIVKVLHANSIETKGGCLEHVFPFNLEYSRPTEKQYWNIKNWKH